VARGSPSPITIQLSGAYRFDQIERLFRNLAPAFGVRRRRRISFDLSRLVAVGPSALAVIVALLKDLQEREMFAPGSILTLPDSKSVSNYVQRMDLVRILAFPEEVEEPFERRPPVGFRPCREFVTSDECAEVARSLTDALTETCETDATARAAIRICLDELVENVVHHADTPLGGFAAAQGWKRSSQFEIAIADLGVGIRGSLTNNPDYADIEDDVTAIRMALRPRVTATPERNSGIGLYVTRALLRANGGGLVLRSGRAAVYSGAHEREEPSLDHFPGTLAALRARIDRPLNIRDVYRRLDDDDGEDGGGDRA
jgi:hypothetical protein